jgi:LasA protease
MNAFEGRLRKAILVFLMYFAALPALACGASAPTGMPGDHSAQELRQTMAAMQPNTFPNPTMPVRGPEQPPPAATLVPGVGATPWPTVPSNPGAAFFYTTRSGDTLAALAKRFGVEVSEIAVPQGSLVEASAPANPLEVSYLRIGLELHIPNTLTGDSGSASEVVTPGAPLLPDSAIVYSPDAADFDVWAYIQQAGGFLDAYQEEVDGETLSGAAIIQQVANELSVNPRLLLAFLEYRSGWVFGQPRNPGDLSQPIGFNIPDRKGLYQEIMIVATQANVAYYGWRQGTYTTLTYMDSSKARINPVLNPGSVAAQHLLAMFNRPGTWSAALTGEQGFLALYNRLFGDPWSRATEPLLPANLVQPALALPFTAEYRWALTAGPHNSWNAGTPRGALDFSPVTGQPKCQVSAAWVTAAAPGLVVRSADNAVVIDLEGDGYEHVGWALLYYHIADQERVAAPVWVSLDDRLGHPSCEGGRATGTHVHLARKYNGEWLAADGPAPFVLDGWRAVAGALNYQGSLVRNGEVVDAKPGGERGSTIIRSAP